MGQLERRASGDMWYSHVIGQVAFTPGSECCRNKYIYTITKNSCFQVFILYITPFNYNSSISTGRLVLLSHHMRKSRELKQTGWFRICRITDWICRITVLTRPSICIQNRTHFVLPCGIIKPLSGSMICALVRFALP